MTFHVPEKFRLKDGAYASDSEHGNNGAFLVKLKISQTVLVVASDGMGWEHVSVSRKDRCPTWEEMSQIKDMFWDGDDCVIQYHPAKRDYVNIHPYCLHLWRPVGIDFPQPDSIMVGPKIKEAA